MLIESASAAPRKLRSVSSLVGTGPSAAGCRGPSGDPSGIAPIAEEHRPPGRAFWSLRPSPRPVLLGKRDFPALCVLLSSSTLAHPLSRSGRSRSRKERRGEFRCGVRRNGSILGGSVVSGEV